MTRTTATNITAETTTSVDTTDHMVPAVTGGNLPAAGGRGSDVAGPPGGPYHEGRGRRWPIVVGALIATTVVLAFLSLTIRIPYDSLAPGSARDVNSIVSVRDHPVYPPDGEVLFATVSVRERVSLLEALVGWINPDVDLVPEREIRGTIPPDQYKKMNVEAMDDSKTTAEVLALQELGYTDLGAGAEVTAVEPGLPADKVLRPADVIVSVDGKAVRTSADAVAAIKARKPGDTITLRVERQGEPPLDLTAVLAEGDKGQALLGVRLGTKVKLPFPIDIDSGSVEGPSAGLPYALELLDYLTPGELTGGASVAATGELAPDGRVGPVGGIAQKAAAVRRTDAKLFLVPQDNFAEAKAHAGGDLEVRAVSNFDQALEALNSIPGSNALALGRPEGGPA